MAKVVLGRALCNALSGANGARTRPNRTMYLFTRYVLPYLGFYYVGTYLPRNVAHRSHSGKLSLAGKPVLIG
jgi:hypothetical protein